VAAAVSGKTILNLNPAEHWTWWGRFLRLMPRMWRLPWPRPKSLRYMETGSGAEAGRDSREGRQHSHPKQGKIRAGYDAQMGKVLAETRGDVQEAIDEAFYVAGEGRRLFGKTTPSEFTE